MFLYLFDIFHFQIKSVVHSFFPKFVPPHVDRYQLRLTTALCPLTSRPLGYTPPGVTASGAQSQRPRPAAPVLISGIFPGGRHPDSRLLHLNELRGFPSSSPNHSRVGERTAKLRPAGPIVGAGLADRVEDVLKASSVTSFL